MNILILGATSSIARAIANRLAIEGHQLYLASRDLPELSRLAKDIHTRYGTTPFYGLFSAEDFPSHKTLWQDALDKMQKIDGVIFATGYLGDPEIHTDFQEQKKIIDTNFTGAVSMINQSVLYFSEQKKGLILAISSVAGDRGRQGNYIYNSTKAALTVYLQGLRNRYFATGVRIINIRLGLVDSAMTWGIPYSLLLVKPETVANTILKILHSSADDCYVPGFWRYIMLIVKLIPERIYKRLRV